jgi:signal recognition particle GTPase
MVKAAQRLTNVQNLQNLIVQAIDPKEKQDLANRLAAEQAAIQADSNVISLYKENRGQQLADLESNKTAAHNQAAIDAICISAAGRKSQYIKTKYGCTNY